MSALIKDPLRTAVPEQRYKLIRRILPTALHPYLRGIKKYITKENHSNEEPFCHTYTFTQVALSRQKFILDTVRSLIDNGIEGDLVECGVLDGGTAAVAAYAARDSDRKIHLFDAWRGLPKPVDKDGVGAEVWENDVVGSLQRVKSVLQRVGANIENISFHIGWFDETYPKADIKKIAYINVDCDFYEPVLLTLDTWSKKITPGGIMLIDDYSAYEGCRAAVNEFLERPENRGLKLEKNDVAYFIRF